MPTTSRTHRACQAAHHRRVKSPSRFRRRSSRPEARAERRRRPLVGSVITVPAYFDDAQRQATKDAARLPASTSCGCSTSDRGGDRLGLDNGAEGIYAVFDLGGGTFDFSILRLAKAFEVMATAAIQRSRR